MTSLKVGNISYRTRTLDLHHIFGKFGDVGDVYIPRDKHSKHSRGFAFVSYGRPPPRIDGMVSLKVDNLTFRTTPDDLRRVFERCGEVGDIYIPRDRFSRESRGFAFVRFYDKRDAEDALDAMDGRILDGRELRVQMARYGRPSSPYRSRGRRRGDHDQGVVRDQDREDDHINPIQDLVVVPGQIVKAHMEDLKADHVQNQENAVGHVPGLNNLKRQKKLSFLLSKTESILNLKAFNLINSQFERIK
ncbi:serine/arginine rich splicing factor, putative [Pediculus humanus corporis]|uniref:Serine/arginine-rich splicing factor 2 n=1 Tax=Pediculus humanus subsp. corporis TaxID=121224 RepID=E0VC94_PEDHC|nr:serine/arginine rich splicing factor, putative [Pediculus humanus corporis]EEB11016.1 serine/arginine rich splicing factor, putative [Pediculus humanus corporis]